MSYLIGFYTGKVVKVILFLVLMALLIKFIMKH